MRKPDLIWQDQSSWTFNCQKVCTWQIYRNTWFNYTKKKIEKKTFSLELQSSRDKLLFRKVSHFPYLTFQWTIKKIHKQFTFTEETVKYTYTFNYGQLIFISCVKKNIRYIFNKLNVLSNIKWCWKKIHRIWRFLLCSTTTKCNQSTWKHIRCRAPWHLLSPSSTVSLRSPDWAGRYRPKESLDVFMRRHRSADFVICD